MFIIQNQIFKTVKKLFQKNLTHWSYHLKLFASYNNTTMRNGRLTVRQAQATFNFHNNIEHNIIYLSKIIVC